MLDTIFTAGLSVFGSVGVVQSLKDVVRGRQSESWPVIAAHVLDSWVEERRGRHGGIRFVPVVRYQYQFGGETFKGQQLRFSEIWTPSRDLAESLLEPLKPGTRLPIRACPSHPRISVIEPGTDYRAGFRLAFFVGFTALTAFAAYQTIQ